MSIDPRPALAATLLLSASLLGSGAARAADLDLPGGCATAGSASLDEAGPNGGFEAGRLEVVIPGASTTPPPALHAASLRVTSQRAAAGVSTAQLEQAATAAAATLLTALSVHHTGACPDHVLQEAMRPLAHGVQAGGAYEFTWSDVSVRAGSTRFGAHRLALRVGGDGRTAQLVGSLEGAASNDRAAALLPESLEVRVALPASELPPLLSAAGGHGAPVDVAIEQVRARRGDSTLEGHGQASIAGEPGAGSGQGQVTITGLDALMEAANAPGLERLRTGLFLARLVAHRDGDRSEWDLAWRQGTLLVNNVPLPLR
ncbi:hypothetical protein [Lichenicola sp.]|uniref:hypothetical protein n=1 Tax=Lichenicola sp. TaxID=2804529 RepID=UPI003B00789E